MEDSFGSDQLAVAELVGTDTNGVYLKAVTGAGQPLIVHIDAAEEGVIRVRSTTNPAISFQATNPMVSSCADGYPEAIVELDERAVSVHAGCLTAQITLAPWRLTFTHETTRILVDQCQDGQERFRAHPEEQFAGFTGAALAGWHRQNIKQVNRAAGELPLCISSRGYGVLVDAGPTIEFDLCASDPGRFSFQTSAELLDYYLIAGPTPREVLARYRRLVPLSPPPQWAVGPWFRAPQDDQSDQEALRLAISIRQASIPADAIHLDRIWYPGDPVPVNTLEILANLGFRTSLRVSPCLPESHPLFPTAVKRRVLLHHNNGQIYPGLHRELGREYHVGILDLSKAEAASWLTDLLCPLFAAGLDAVAIDLPEVELPDQIRVTDGTSGAGQWQRYPSQLRQLIRCAASSAERPPVLIWSNTDPISERPQFIDCSPTDTGEQVQMLLTKLTHWQQLIPYLHAAALDSTTSGVPLVRASLVDRPAESANWMENQGYQLGPDLFMSADQELSMPVMPVALCDDRHNGHEARFHSPKVCYPLTAPIITPFVK